MGESPLLSAGFTTEHRENGLSSKIDVLFMAPTILIYGQQWSSTPGLFLKKSSLVKLLVTRHAKDLYGHLYDKRVPLMEENLFMPQCRLDSS